MSTRPGFAQHQRGTYAIEFALVFSLLFMMLYAALTYGFIFMAQQSLNRAANTGARALLVWNGTGGAATGLSDVEQAVVNNTRWVSQMAGLVAGGGVPAVQASVCVPGSGLAEQVDPLGVCGDFDASAQGGALSPAAALVVVRYDYQQAPLIPVLGLGVIRLPVPVALEAQAQVDLGVRYPGEPEAQ